MSMKTDFVLVTSDRCGSAWFMDTFNRINGVKAYGELFLPRPRGGNTILADDRPRYVEYQDQCPRARRPFATFTFLDELYDQPGSVGFKIMYSQMRRYPEVMLYFVKHHVRIVHLIRRNHLDVIISQTRAKLAGTSHTRVGDSETSPNRLDIDVGILLPSLKRLRRTQRLAKVFVKVLSDRLIEVAYEDLLESSTEWHRVYAFLGIDAEIARPVSGLKKRGARDKSTVIANYDEIRNKLAGTDYYGLLES